MNHLRAQLEKFKASAESYAKANETLGYPVTAARYEGEASAYATALALLDGATRPTGLLPKTPRPASSLHSKSNIQNSKS